MSTDVEPCLVETSTNVYVWKDTLVSVTFVAPWTIVMTLTGKTITEVHIPAGRADWIMHGSVVNLDGGCNRAIDITTESGSNCRTVNSVTLLFDSEATMEAVRQDYVKAVKAFEALAKEEEDHNRATKAFLDALHPPEEQVSDSEIIAAVEKERAEEAAIMAEAEKAWNEMFQKNLCMMCGVDMGSSNPRQLCGKIVCHGYGFEA